MFNTCNIGQHRPEKTWAPTQLQPPLPLTPSIWSIEKARPLDSEADCITEQFLGPPIPCIHDRLALTCLDIRVPIVALRGRGQDIFDLALQLSNQVVHFPLVAQIKQVAEFVEQ